MREFTRIAAPKGSVLTFLLCTAAWVAHAPPAQGQETPVKSATEATPDTSLDRRRLLTLDDGSVLRVRSRRYHQSDTR